MFIELVETLRCVREHGESWLVASIDDLRERSIRAGTLGCPVCGARYPIIDGVADFSGGRCRPVSDALSSIEASDLAMRAGAFLALGETRGTIVLGGGWARGAGDLVRSLDVRVIAVNASPEVEESPAIALVKISDAIPMAARACAGAALDASFTREAYRSAQKVVRAGGRIVGVNAATPPDGVTVIAEDGSWWVGENPREITTLRRGSR